LVHGSLNHLFSNLPPLLFSIFLIRYFYKKQFALIFIANYLLTGVMVWCFARDVSHIGISGVVYALISFIFWTGIFVRNKTSIILALLVLMVYSGMFSGILPLPEMIEKNISWESHLLGGLVGILVAWWQKDTIKETLSIQSTPRTYTTEEPRQPYLPPDTFDKPNGNVIWMNRNQNSIHSNKNIRPICKVYNSNIFFHLSTKLSYDGDIAFIDYFSAVSHQQYYLIHKDCRRIGRCSPYLPFQPYPPHLAVHP
jgi:hypothetical protein